MVSYVVVVSVWVFGVFLLCLSACRGFGFVEFLGGGGVCDGGDWGGGLGCVGFGESEGEDGGDEGDEGEEGEEDDECDDGEPGFFGWCFPNCSRCGGFFCR